MDYTELNKSLKQSHNNLLRANIDLQKKLLKSKKESETVAKFFLASLGINFVLVSLLFSVLSRGGHYDTTHANKLQK